MAVLRTAVSALAMYDTDAADMSRAANVRKAIHLTARIPTIVAAFDRLRNGRQPIAPRPGMSLAEDFLFMLSGVEPAVEDARAMDVALILHADHELNASTFAAREVASTLADMYGAITAAIATLAGPSHGGANEEVMRMLEAIGSARSGRRVGAGRAAAARADHGLRPRRLQGRGPAGDRAAHARASRWASAPATIAGTRSPSGWSERSVEEKGLYAERRLLLRLGLPCPWHPDRSVHPGFRLQPDRRLDGARAGAVREQPPDAPPRRLHRPGSTLLRRDRDPRLAADQAFSGW